MPERVGARTASSPDAAVVDVWPVVPDLAHYPTRPAGRRRRRGSRSARPPVATSTSAHVERLAGPASLKIMGARRRRWGTYVRRQRGRRGTPPTPRRRMCHAPTGSMTRTMGQFGDIGVPGRRIQSRNSGAVRARFDGRSNHPTAGNIRKGWAVSGGRCNDKTIIHLCGRVPIKDFAGSTI